MRWILPLILCSSALWAEVAVVHPQVIDADISASRLRDLFLGRVSAWRDGTPVVIVLVDDLTEDGAVRQITGRNLTTLLRGWKRLVYSGGGAMPVVVANRADALNYVASHRGAVAVLNAADADSRWRVVPLVH